MAGLSVAVWLGLPIGEAAQAQAIAPIPMPPAAQADMAAHPDRFVGRKVDWGEGYCFFDQPTFVCVGANQPFEVVAPRLGPETVKANLKSNCAGLDGIERNPSPQCAYHFSFVVGGYEPIVGDYVLNGELMSEAKMIRFRAEALTIRKR